MYSRERHSYFLRFASEKSVIEDDYIRYNNLDKLLEDIFLQKSLYINYKNINRLLELF
jgi:hypothetical protein